MSQEVEQDNFIRGFIAGILLMIIVLIFAIIPIIGESYNAGYINGYTRRQYELDHQDTVKAVLSSFNNSGQVVYKLNPNR